MPALAARAPVADLELPDEEASDASLLPVPAWITSAHLLFMAWTVFTAHYPALFLGGFLFFLGFVRATAAYQSRLALKTPLLVGFFLVAFVHASLVAGQQDLDEMRTRIAELQAEKASVQRGIEESSSPARINDRAAELGMVRAEDPVFLAAVRPLTPAPVAPAGGEHSAG